MLKFFKQAFFPYRLEKTKRWKMEVRLGLKMLKKHPLTIIENETNILQ